MDGKRMSRAEAADMLSDVRRSLSSMSLLISAYMTEEGLGSEHENSDLWALVDLCDLNVDRAEMVYHSLVSECSSGSNKRAAEAETE